MIQDVTKPIPSQLCGSKPALIFNLAAVHTTPGHEEWEYYHTNVLAACHICQYASAVGATKIIFTSSIAVYGPAEAIKDEDLELEPVSAYGRSKAMAEAIHQLWQSERPEQRQLTVVRPAVIYGFKERGNFTRLAQLLGKGRFVYPGRKDAIKSCGYVKDLVSSMLYMSEKTEGISVYNFCYPERYTTKDICDAFCDVAGFKTPKVVVPLKLMLLGGLAFEILGKFGLNTKVNRERVRKLFYSTNIVPKRLQDAGFSHAYGLRSSLSDWRGSSREFV